METIQEFVDELNAFLAIRQVKPKMTIKPLLYSIKEKFNCRYIFLKSSYYTEEILKELKQLKINYVKAARFELAAKFRELEEECRHYSGIRDRIHATTSKFHFESDTLMYFSAGDTYLDRSVEMYFKELS